MKQKRWILCILFVLAVCLSGCGSDDGEDRKERDGEPTEHTHVWVEADCVAPKHCEVCGQTIGEAIGHSWVDATCTAPKTCAKCGKTEGKPLDHVWQEATCTTPETCSMCGATRGTLLGHDTSGATCTEDSKCSRCGKVVLALGHSWKNATCTEPAKCNRCGAEEGEPLGHSWAEATCAAPKTCTRCKITEGAALPHDWAEATCESPKTCKVCSQQEGSALGHDFVKGKCSRCGKTDPNYVPPETFEDNSYFEITEEASFKNSIDYTILVKKILARKDCYVEATIIAYNAKGDVIGKSSSEAILTAGEANFFRFSFEQSISKATLEISFSVSDDYWLAGPRDAVELVKHNRSGDYLYLTFKQTKDDLGGFAKFKLLLYKGNKIVGTEEGYFSIYAENMTGKGATDVAQLWVYGEKFDKIEYIFEP